MVGSQKDLLTSYGWTFETFGLGPTPKTTAAKLLVVEILWFQDRHFASAWCGSHWEHFTYFTAIGPRRICQLDSFLDPNVETHPAIIQLSSSYQLLLHEASGCLWTLSTQVLAFHMLQFLVSRSEVPECALKRLHGGFWTSLRSFKMSITSIWCHQVSVLNVFLWNINLMNSNKHQPFRTCAGRNRIQELTPWTQVLLWSFKAKLSS